jgi:tripartite ATP-independent transporter DctP family solute receptor
MKWLRFLLSIACAASLLAGTAAAQETVIQFGHVGNPGSLFALSAEEFATRANERLAGQARVEVFGSSQLGTDEQLMQRLRLGTVDIALPSTVMSTVADVFGLFEMPYLVRDREHMKRIEAEIVWPVLAPAAEAQGYKIIAVWENGFRHITNNVRPIVTPDDLRGVKLRTPSGEWRVRMFQAYGANPSPMAFSELFVALQTGVMDGQENPFTQIHSARLQEVQRYLSLSGHVYTPAYVTVGARNWANLPAEVREVLEEVAREVQDFVYETAAEMDTALLEELAADLEINEVDTDAFIEASQSVYETFGREVSGGAELIERALELGQDQ